MLIPSSTHLPTLRELSIVAKEGRQIIKSLLRQEQSLIEPGSEADIKQALREGDEERQRSAMTSLVTGYCLYKRYHRLYPEVVKIMGTSSLEVKRLCYIFLVLACQVAPTKGYSGDGCSSGHQGYQPESAHPVGVHDDDTSAMTAAALLTVNGFQKDASHRNHIVRAWALRAMSLIKIDEVVPSTVEAMRRGVGDGSPFVRLTVAQACPKLVSYDSTLVGFVVESILLRLFYDVEDAVVAAALHSFYQITLMFPDLLQVDLPTRRHCVDTYSLSLPRTEHDTGTSDANPPPLLACFHPVFCRLVTYVIERLPHHGQVAAIYLLTHYCRTFFLSPDAASNIESSGHYQLFLSKLHCFKYSNSSAVLLAACRGLLVLSSSVSLSESLHEMVPFVLHRLRVSKPGQKAELLDLLVAIAQRSHHESLQLALPAVALRYQDTPRIKRSKLRLLQELVVFPDVPVDSICDDLLTATQWNVTPSESWSNDELFDAVIMILATRLRRELSVPLETLIEKLLSRAGAVSTPSLLQQTMRTLCEITRLSERLHPDRMQSILLLVARRVVLMLDDPSCCVGGAGLAAAVELLAAHHTTAPDISLDVFRVLVGTITSDSLVARVDAELQLAVLNFGASLWAWHASQQKENPEMFAKLDRLWSHFLTTLQSSRCPNSTVRDTAFLCSRFVNSSPEILRRVFGATASASVKTVSGVAEPGPADYQLGTLSFATRLRLQGLHRLPDFIGPSSHDSDRQPVSDTVRARPLSSSILPPTAAQGINTSGSQKQPAQKSEDDEDVDGFYGSTDWNVAHSHLAASDRVDPLVSLFGPRGVVVYGEEAETSEDDDADTVTPRNAGPHSSSQLADHHKENQTNGDDEDEEEWYRIKQTVLAAPSLADGQ